MSAVPQATAYAPMRASIETLEETLVKLPQIDIPPVHRFASGMYVREITIPADTLMTGKVHLAEHVSIMLSGDMTVLTETGVRRVQGPEVFISPPGTKRVGYAHSEVKWVTVHLNPDDEQDISVIEARLVEPWKYDNLLAAAKSEVVA